MAFWSSVVGLMVVIAAAGIALESSVASATSNHVVGDSSGWMIPSNASLYSDWAAGQTFAVGDTIEFDFKTGQHEVVHVPKSGYDSCSTTNQIGSILSTGPASFTLSAAGDYYFICGFPGHCNNGQKLAVSIGSSPSGSSPSGASPAPTSGPTNSTSTPGFSGGSTPPSAATLPSGMRTAVGFSLVVAVLSSLLF